MFIDTSTSADLEAKLTIKYSGNMSFPYMGGYALLHLFIGIPLNSLVLRENIWARKKKNSNISTSTNLEVQQTAWKKEYYDKRRKRHIYFIIFAQYF